MDKLKKIIVFKQNDTKILDSGELSFIRSHDLDNLKNDISSLAYLTRSVDGSKFIFKTKSNVGALVTRGLRVEVRPDLPPHLFFTFLRYTLGGKIPLIKIRNTAPVSWDTGFEDSLGYLLNNETDKILSTGISRRYLELNEPLQVLRGRPLWEKNFPWRGNDSTSITCRYHKLSYDNLDNQLLLAGLLCASRMVNHKEIRGGLLSHSNTFLQLARETIVEFSDFDKVTTSYSRLNEHYMCAHGLCKLFLSGLRPESAFKNDNKSVSGISLNMALLFEQFVERLLREVFEPQGFKIKPQASDRRAFYDADRKWYASARPDFEVWRGGKLHGVIDAKYKQYWVQDEKNSSPKVKISNDDLYQLFFYQKRLQLRENLAYPPLTFIAAPMPDENEREGKHVVDEKFKTITWASHDNTGGSVKLRFIPVSRYLKIISGDLKIDKLEVHNQIAQDFLCDC